MLQAQIYLGLHFLSSPYLGLGWETVLLRSFSAKTSQLPTGSKINSTGISQADNTIAVSAFGKMALLTMELGADNSEPQTAPFPLELRSEFLTFEPLILGNLASRTSTLGIYFGPIPPSAQTIDMVLQEQICYPCALQSSAFCIIKKKKVDHGSKWDMTGHGALLKVYRKNKEIQATQVDIPCTSGMVVLPRQDTYQTSLLKRKYEEVDNRNVPLDECCPLVLQNYARGASVATAGSPSVEYVASGWLTKEGYSLIQGEVLTSMMDKYKVLDFLGHGAFGEVVKCRKQSTKEKVAIKMLTFGSLFEAQNELNILAQLVKENAYHYNIVKGYEYFCHNSSPCFVFEMLEQDLHSFLKKNNFCPLSLIHVRYILEQLATALMKLKSLGIMHADLKPANIMLVDQIRQPYRVKVVDFGLALHMSKARCCTSFGTRYYRAPEMILGLPLSEAFDMWSLGCVLAELFLGVPLYPAASDYDLIRYISETQGLPPQSLLTEGHLTRRYFTEDSFFEILWRLKTPEEYKADTGINSIERRKYIFRSLEDMIQVNMQRKLELRDLLIEYVRRVDFVNLLKKMLTIDAAERITPAETLRHPFVEIALTAEISHAHYGQHCNPIINQPVLLERNNKLPSTELPNAGLDPLMKQQSTNIFFHWKNKLTHSSSRTDFNGILSFKPGLTCLEFDNPFDFHSFRIISDISPSRTGVIHLKNHELKCEFEKLYSSINVY
ncbi:homeodomain-interacting protein kinase 2-like [Protopterus annectens]|uniref:homeodomain-interacting protein kinase 2-like n=1 Tax=Protopterus annectens TaxID=7888 RepID=UPI001CFC26A3|nr:homeodomain-interacting protein kinase 2-like [Protopterus annectens]